jgi:methylated-DNA-[protein]-cysteine S-methyltransferase
MTVSYTTMNSPVGKIGVAWGEDALHAVWLGSGGRAFVRSKGWREVANLRCEAVDQLRAYFNGKLRTFDLPLVLEGTDFQKEVWRALTGVPFGRTISYGELADRVGRPRAARAVGAANGRNPIPIVLPCHRVIGSGGELRGYAGGVDIKAKLLAHEGILTDNLL